MATKHKCVQGSSFAYDLTCEELPTLDSNWGGSWAIVDALDDLVTEEVEGSGTTDNLVTRASGVLVLSPDNTTLELRIPPADTSTIATGSYVLVAQVVNTVLEFSEEVMQDSFEITEQGIA